MFGHPLAEKGGLEALEELESQLKEESVERKTRGW